MRSSAIVDIQNSFGAVFVGLLVNVMLCGLEIAQAWIYYWQYWHRDKTPFKLFVAFLILMDTMGSILCALAIYWHLVLNFGIVESLAASVWFMNAVPLFSAIPNCAVQLYYVRRAYIMSQSLICPIIVVPLVIFSTFFGYFFTIKTLTVSDISKIHTAPWLPSFSMGTVVLGDIVVTATICWSLYRKRTGIAKTDSMIATLMVNTVNSGFLLTAIATAMVILFSVARSNLVWLAIVWVQSKCFVNSLLATLNSRDYIRNRSTTDNPLESAYKLPSIRIGPQSNSEPGQPAVAVTMCSSIALEFAQSKSGHAAGLATLEDTKPSKGDEEV